MSATLQDAIASARAGDIGQAQLIVAEVIQANPDDANAWYLMSQLVDSDARRMVYLRKTLALDPSHALAAAEFDALPDASPDPEVSGTGVAVYADDSLAAVDYAPASEPALPANATIAPELPPVEYHVEPEPAESSSGWLTLLLVILVILAIAALAYLIYLLVT